MNVRQDTIIPLSSQSPRLHRGIPEPFFFGPADKSLFGCLHRLQINRSKKWGVILCYPIGYEHVRSHRAYRQLANSLTRSGFQTLRFDYFGSGDSAGDFSEASIPQWLSDVSSAIREISQKCGVERVCLVGCRLGAALALLAGVGRAEVEATVLWDPVVSGTEYLEQLEYAHRHMLLNAHVMPKSGGASKMGNERLGFPLTQALHSDLEKINLLDFRQRPAKSILLIESKQQPASKQFVSHLQDAGARVDHQVVPCSLVWDWRESVAQMLVPTQILNSIVAWINEVCL